MIEIKCPFSGKEKTVLELIASGYSHLTLNNDSFALKESSNYYYQVQGEMAIKNCDLCHFVVWTPYDIQIIPVHFNSSFWENELLPKLQSFFNTHIKPKLLTTLT